METQPAAQGRLPIYEIEGAFREAFSREGAAIAVTAPTGSGKSTQLPKWLLTALPPEKKVLVLQPRRLAARVLAERVAAELGSKTGDIVGFTTRFERAYSKATRILFVTEGILVRMLLSPEELKDYGAIVFDEFHERTINADLALALAQSLREKSRPDLKLVVMSATLAIQQVVDYLPNCQSLAANGRCFPVTTRYIQRGNRPTDLYQEAARGVHDIIVSGQPGDILVFMPGAGEIRRCIDAIDGFNHGGERLLLLPLHGALPPEAQHDVMAPASTGTRKVIVATNIAETSLTIPGVRHVIDSGLVKLNRYDPARGIDVLEMLPISAASAEQRTGRAGREAPGDCLRLWSTIEQDHKPPQTTPEIRRMDLADALLTIHACGFPSANDFPWFEAPPENAVVAAEALLANLGLVAQDGTLTQLGRMLRTFPLHPRLALLLWSGHATGCYDLACGAAALLSERPIMLASHHAPPDSDGFRRSFRRNRSNPAENAAAPPPESDFLWQLHLVRQAKNANFAPDACNRMGVNGSAAREVARAEEYYRSLKPRQAPDASATTMDAESALALALLRSFPDRLCHRIDNGTLLCEMTNRKRATLENTSVVRDEPLLVAGEIREASTTTLSLASGVREEWLWDYFTDSLQEIDECLWDNTRQQVMHRRSLSCLGVVIEESLRPAQPTEDASQLLCRQLDANNMPLLGWDDDCEAFISRVRFLRPLFPELNLPGFNDEECAAVRAAVCQGETRYAAIRNKPVLPFLQALLDANQLAKVNHLAPATLPLPRNRKMRLTYIPGQPPKGRARIQELYDLAGPVTVANGRAKVLLDILAPNYRTVQITDDLPRFWEVHYPAMKTQLSRRYPKHEWR